MHPTDRHDQKRNLYLTPMPGTTTMPVPPAVKAMCPVGLREAAPDLERGAGYPRGRVGASAGHRNAHVSVADGKFSTDRADP
jgi:hypothetical protein